MLRVPRRGGQHNVRAARSPRARVLRQRHLLSQWRHLHNRLPAVLQAGHTTVLSDKASLRFHYYIPPGLWHLSLLIE